MVSVLASSVVDHGFEPETTVRGKTCRSTRTHYSDSESLLFLLNATYLAEKQQIPIL
jgi:hypothetical protein